MSRPQGIPLLEEDDDDYRGDMRVDGYSARNGGGGGGDGERLIQSKDVRFHDDGGDHNGSNNEDIAPYIDSVYDPMLDAAASSGAAPSSSTDQNSLMTTAEAALAFFKSNWGIGFLGTPFAFSKAGVIGGVVCFGVLVVLVVFTTRLLIKCKEELRAQGVRVSTLSEISRVILGSKFDILVTALVAIAQVGDCALYIIFVGRAIEAIFTPRVVGGFYYYIVTVSLLPVLLPLVLVRRIKRLMGAVYIALLFMTVSVFVIIIFGIMHTTPTCIDPVTEFAEQCTVLLLDLASLPVFLGIVSFALEGVQNVMPIHEAMRVPGDFNKMLYSTYGILSVIYIAFGVSVYVLFANETKSVIAVNITGTMGIVVKVLLSAMLVFTYPIQMFPVAHIIDHKMKWTSDDPRLVRYSRICRVILLVITVGLAVGIPYFGNLLSLIGCTCVTFLGFFLPSLLYMRNFEKSIRGWEQSLCVLCIFAAVIVTVSGMVINIKALISHPTS